MIYERLSKREKQIVKMVCEEGITDNKQIAEKMQISYFTVKSHFWSIYKKTLLTSKEEMIFKYYNGGKEEWGIK